MAHNRASRVRTNVIANFIGGAWSALMAILFIPTYIRYLGPEAYGLVGVFVLLQTILILLDFGLSAAASRQLARGVTEQDRHDARDLVRTLEVVFWAVAFSLVLLAWVTAPLAAAWLRPSQLSSAAVANAMVLIGVAIAAQWPSMLYGGSLQGLQRQALWNAVVVVGSTFRSGGAVLVLLFVAPTITAFFTWQIVVAIAQTVILAVVTWWVLPGKGRKPRVRWTLIRRHWRFAAGSAGIYAFALVLAQLDKVVLTRLLSLETFGYYALAGVVASGVYRVAGPISAAVYPQLTNLDAHGEHQRLATLYHTACQWVGVLLFPAAAIIALFSRQLLGLWTGNIAVVNAAGALVSVLVVGAVFASLMYMPLVLQLAHGYTRLALSANIAAAVLLVPALIGGVRILGALGAAIAWLTVNVIYFVVVGYLAHNRFAPLETRKWFVNDTAIPMLVAAATAMMARGLFPEGLSAVPTFAWVAASGIVTLAACVSVAHHVRSRVLAFWKTEQAGPAPRDHQAEGVL